MSEIFLAFQRGLAGFRKLLVIKSILPNIRGEEEFVRMFLDEAKITAAFNHPNIAQVYDLDIDDEQLFLAMEFVPGCTLVELARACRSANEPIPTGLTLLAVKETALALHYAHTFTNPLGEKQTVIHRDVAEKNIMVTFEGTTKLLDFGIAKSLNRTGRTSVGMVKGTSGYMSPEQILGEKLDARSDMFSLGVVLHECLTGMRLFHGKDAEAGMLAALKEEAAPPSRLNPEVTPELDAVVLKSLARKREDRYATCLEFGRALERVAGPLMWHAEQTGELVHRLFADRREQTRQLLEQAQHGTGDLTGEIRLKGLLGDPASAPRATPLKPSAALATPKRPFDSMTTRAASAPPAEPPPRPAAKRNPGVVVSPSTAPLPAARGSGMRAAPDARMTTETPTPVTGRPAPVSPAAPPPPPEPESVFEERTQVGIDAPHLRDNPSGQLPWSSSRAKAEDDDIGMRTTPASALPADLFDLDETSAKRSVTGDTLTNTSRSRPGAPELAPEPDTSPGSAAASSRKRSKVPLVLGVVVVLAVLAGAAYALDLPGRFAGDEVPPAEVKPPPPPKVEVTPPKTPPPESVAVVEPPKPEPVPAVNLEPDPEPVDEAPAPPEPKAAAPGRSAQAAAEAKTPARPVRPKRRPPPEPKEKAASKTPDSAADKAWESAAAKKPGALGQLTLVTDPWAKVLLKSQELGVTPLFKVNLPVGRQTLKLIGADQKVLLLQVDIKEGAVTAVRVPLSALGGE
ncbi:MAG: serine/threonine-protein kinase [Myxococcaceae bacterium]